MRLWHKDLIPYLPRQQLLGQWRECCCIVRNIAMLGTPNHILVNKVMDYPMGHFWYYGLCVMEEMENRGYKCDFNKFKRWFNNPYTFPTPTNDGLFEDWHNNRYLVQCLYNLQEKYDCGGIPEEEWFIIANVFDKEMRFCP